MSVSLALALLAGCQGNPVQGDATQGSSTDPSPTSTTDPPVTDPPPTSTTAPTSTGEFPQDTGSSTIEGTDSSTVGATLDTGSSGTDGTETNGPDECGFVESFDGLPNGSAWPAPWTSVGGVLLADVQGGRGRLLPVTSDYSLARMFAPLACADVEGTFTFEMSDPQTQGVGFYLRQNAGFLTDTAPPGEGYASFSQAFTPPHGISVWREVDGEEMILSQYAPNPIAAGMVYAVRFRVTQLDATTTRLQTRIWPAGSAEPGSWDVDVTDDTPSLQDQPGGLAIDAWSQHIAGIPSDLFVDDIVVTSAP
ncbi:hypothetical protein [Paraliomyxa miuraensis]|uniref:hypothetical protein n=1 Tax=Paraliomyxa miuraensis TaxID=376150 RepID=UPI0022591059|nr:hypothetical protein [Paraliomyxa miuraensis]MCX4241876.1 hypothetical protein [Paraliomyxa miuraensis]